MHELILVSRYLLCVLEVPLYFFHMVAVQELRCALYSLVGVVRTSPLVLMLWFDVVVIKNSLLLHMMSALIF